MKKVLLILITCCSIYNGTNAQTQQQDIEAVKTVCNYYLDGGTNGDSVLYSKAFSFSGLMQYMRNDTLQVGSFAKRFYSKNEKLRHKARS
jgi:hypothetical protein